MALPCPTPYKLGIRCINLEYTVYLLQTQSGLRFRGLFVKYNFILTYLDQWLTHQKKSDPNSLIGSTLRSQISNLKSIHLLVD